MIWMIRRGILLTVAAILVLVLLSLGNFSFLGGQIVRVLVGLAFLGFLITAFAEDRVKLPMSFGFWLGGLMFWLLLQQFAIMLRFPGFDIPSTWGNWHPYFSLIVSGVAVFTVSEHLFSQREDLNRILRLFMAASTVLAVYFIYLFFTSGVAVEKIQPPFPLLRHLRGLAGISLQPNNLVDLFIPAFFFSCSYTFYNYRRKLNHSDPAKAYSDMFLNLCFACILLAAIFYTKSRAGILSFAAGLFVYSLIFTFSHQQRRSPLKLLGLMFLVGIFFMSSLGFKQVFKELVTLKDIWSVEIEKIGVRTSTIGASLQLVKARGWLGVGLGNFHMGWLFFHEPPYTMFPRRSYNDLLWIWAEMGLPGVLCLMGAAVAALIKGLRTAVTSASAYISYLVCAAMASFVAFAVHSFVDPTFYVEALFLQICLVLGILSACIRMEFLETHEKETMQQASRRGLAGFLIIGGLIFFMSAMAVVQVYASRVASSQDIKMIERVAHLDTFNAAYPRLLSANYYQNYLEQGTEEDLAKALYAMDEAILRDPFATANYRKRAEMMLQSGNLKSIEKSFEMMREHLPDFYIGELTATSFYMDASMEAGPDAASRFKAMALRHYNKAFDLNPRLSRHWELYPLMSLEAQQEFEALLNQHPT